MTTAKWTVPVSFRKKKKNKKGKKKSRQLDRGEKKKGNPVASPWQRKVNDLAMNDWFFTSYVQSISELGLYPNLSCTEPVTLCLQPAVPPKLLWCSEPAGLVGNAWRRSCFGGGWAPSEGSPGKSASALHLQQAGETSATWHHLQPRLNPTLQKWWGGGEPREAPKGMSCPERWLRVWQWFEPITHTGFCHHCSFSMWRILWEQENKMSLFLQRCFLLPTNCPFTLSKSFRCVFFLTTMTFWASQRFWSALRPVMALGEHITPGICWQRNTAGGCEKVLPEMEVQWYLWEQPPGDTASLLPGWHSGTVCSAGCLCGARPCHVGSCTLGARGLKRQTVQQIPKRTELLFHF